MITDDKHIHIFIALSKIYSKRETLYVTNWFLNYLLLKTSIFAVDWGKF